MTIRVLLVEDSRVQRQVLRRTLEVDGDIEIVAQADAADDAVNLIATLRPDLVVLDLHIPGGGLNVITRAMEQRPTPILVLSALVSGEGSEVALEALAAGALEALPKPRRWDAEVEEQLRRRVRALAGVVVARRRAGPPPAPARRNAHGGRVIALAASTGGPATLATVLSGLAGVRAPVLVVQHLHGAFIPSFVTWMGRSTSLLVELATERTLPQPGRVYIGPGGSHLVLGPDRRLRLDSEPAHVHKPSADVLFSSVAAVAGAGAIGVLMTGMGEDGARGLLEIRKAGGVAIAQDEATSVVYGMPFAAQKLGAAEHVLPLPDIAAAVMRAVAGPR